MTTEWSVGWLEMRDDPMDWPPFVSPDGQHVTDLDKISERLNALEACAEALRFMLDGRTSDPFTQNRAAELIARLDALRP